MIRIDEALATYTNDSLIDGISDVISDFWKSYVVETANGAFRIIKTMTYGEMTISFLLLLIFLLLVFKWIYELMRW